MDSLYSGNCPVCAGKEPEKPGTEITFSDRVRDRVLHRLMDHFDIRGGIDPDLFRHTLEQLDRAVVAVGDSLEEPDEAFIRELKHNNAVFAAFKTHRQQNDLATLLIDEEGKPRGFDAFRKATETVVGAYNTVWLRTEYDMAQKAARTGARFREFRRDSDLFPNVEWLPSRAVDPREAHKPYYHNVRAVDDPWWQTHYPGCLYGCQCGMKNTDRPLTHIGDTPAGGQPDGAGPIPGQPTAAPGLDRNPAFTGSVFTDNHPYVRQAYPGAREAVERFVDNLPDREGMKKLKQEAKKLRDEPLTHPSMNGKIMVSGRTIDEWTNQPHKHKKAKDEMLLRIKKVLSESTYLGYGKDKSNKPGCKYVHLLETEVSGDKSWIIVKEYADGKKLLYSISDSEKILEALKEK